MTEDTRSLIRDAERDGAMSAPTVRWNRYGGSAIALLGFLITRQFVAQTMQTDSTLSFVLLSLPPLVIGLSLAVYGVVLAVGLFSPAYVRRVTLWCGLGTGGVALLLAATQVEAVAAGGHMAPLSDAPLLVGNLLLGGAVGGVVVGDRSAANSDKRAELRRTANRAALVNRLLRHEVINGATIIQGHASLLAEHPDRERSVEAITNAADRITETIEVVGRIATPNEGRDLTDVAVGPVLETVVDAHRAADPECRIVLGDVDERLTVIADGRLEAVFDELLENARTHGGGPIRIDVKPTTQAVVVTVADGGPGLDAANRAVLEAGEFPEYDDPGAGFGLQVVSLLVGRYGGRITTSGGVPDGERVGSEGDDGVTGDGEEAAAGDESDDRAPDEATAGGGADDDGATAGDGTAVEPTADIDADETRHEISVWLPRYDTDIAVADRLGLRAPALTRALTAGLFAGLLMGGFYQATTGTMSVIGSLYGVSHAGIGWLTHLFHSTVFALLFAAGCTAIDVRRYASTLPRAGGVGLAWGVVLWFVAAGFVMPAWLVAIGEPASLPTLDLVGLLAHALWGVTLGVSDAVLADRDIVERLLDR